MEQDDELRLIRKAQQGADEAFTALVRLHQARVRTYLRRFAGSKDVVDDLAQETFVSAYKSLDRYEPRASLGSWLLGIARNQALMYLRSEERRRNREGRAMDSAVLAEMAQDLERDDGSRDRHEHEMKALERCIEKLPPESARMMDDFYFKGRSGVEIARKMKRNENTIWSLLMRMRMALRACMEERLA